MAESIDGGRQDDGGSNKRTMPAAGLHPFFTPLSKRANIVTGSDSKLSCDTSSSESKRTKQKASSGAADKRNRKSKSVGKSTTLQSFFSIKPNQNDAQTPELNVMDANDVVSVADAAAEILWQPRPKLRPANPPAPYPTETPHVPAPIFEAFHPVIRAAAMPENKHLGRYCAASIPAALELYAQSQPHVSLDGGSTQWRELAGEIFQLQQQQRMRALSLDGTTGASILASLGAPLRCPPRNLQCTEPLLDILCGRKSHGQGPHSQLLTTRYRPRRARDVLDNCRAVTQLQSWIEGMRLKRASASAAAKISDNTAIGVHTQYSHSRIGNKGATRQNRRPLQRSADSVSDSDDAVHSMHGSDDDDFIPCKPRRARRAKNGDGLSEVLAWAKSDGTMTSVREKMRPPNRHRRRGSESGGSGSEAEAFSNIILLDGPSGSCKTAAVYACASECGFEVYEIHPGQRRSGKDVLAVLEDVIQSHTIAMPTGNTSGADRAVVNQMLILIEHVDVLFEQDQRLWPALKQLALKSRRPIVLTCNDVTCIRWDATCFHSVLRFQRPSEHILVPYVFLLCLAEGVLISPTDIAHTCADAKYDVNRILSQLEFTIRHPQTTDSDHTSLIPAPQTKPTQIDLSGTLAWLSCMLDAGETMQMRYDLWMSLVASAHTFGDKDWFNHWPGQPPPALPPPRLASLSRNEMPAIRPELVAAQNRFFGRGACVGAAPPISTESQAVATRPSNEDTKDVMLHKVTPLVLNKSKCANTSAGVTISCTSDVTQLDAISEAMDVLSLVSTFRDGADTINECLCEPLYTSLSPMDDGCLDVSYVVLDPDVITRRNPTRLADSIGVERQTYMQIDEHLRASASQQLCAFPDLGLDSSDSSPSLASQRSELPLGPSILESDYNSTLLNVRSVMSFVGIPSQQMTAEGIADTVACMSAMVRWDWIHQGKLEAPSAPAAHTDSADDEHFYRVGTRRTRQRTYRAHIKYMSLPMQQLLVSWSPIN
ncbi:hypothetical protein LPJ62_003709 [Coemansia sp. RSA 2167]|nr:hypothetical protein LPJ62_003709 [Coemansia sp. RSA 2167]